LREPNSGTTSMTQLAELLRQAAEAARNASAASAQMRRVHLPSRSAERTLGTFESMQNKSAKPSR